MTRRQLSRSFRFAIATYGAMFLIGFAIRLLDRKPNKLEVVISQGIPAEALNIELFADAEGNGISGYVAATGRSYICPDVERDPRCSIAISIRDADVVVDGRASRVTDATDVALAAQAWGDGGWPAEPDPSGTGITAPFNAPAQGPPPWHVYRIEPSTAVVALGVDPGGLTRFRF